MSMYWQLRRAAARDAAAARREGAGAPRPLEMVQRVPALLSGQPSLSNECAVCSL